ncbi:MAG: hypothetical protein LAO09_05195 [Acidobacteriia bacterium]|nr:hypothetical protein [Terriglobia bacterium]
MRGRDHLAQPVYYNTTGVVVKGSLRQRPQICGYARFDVIGGFDPNYPGRMIDRVFECAEPSMWMGCNKLLFRRLLGAGVHPDGFLVVATSALMGHVNVGTEDWRSPDTWLLSFSECAGNQEMMLLMGTQGWIHSDLGRFVLKPSELRPWPARLAFCAGE